MSKFASTRWLSLIIIVGWVIALASGTVGAQTTYHVSWSKVEEASWTWTAIWSDDGGGPLVHSVVAIMDPAAANDDNLQVVWYIRGDPWTSQTWTTTDPWEAINSIKTQLGIGDGEDDNWEVCSTSGEDQAQPQEYTKGLLASDPSAPAIVASPDRDEIVQELVLLGYPAANLSVDNNNAGCSSDEMLDGLADEFESMIAAGDESVLDLRSSGINCFILAAPPPITKPTKPAAPPAWSPPGTIPTAPGWTSGPWSPWSCRTVVIGGGGTNCICTRSRRWGRWETKTCFCFFTCIKWHEIWETETCTSINPPGGCPAGGPAPAGSACTSTYR